MNKRLIPVGVGGVCDAIAAATFPSPIVHLVFLVFVFVLLPAVTTVQALVQANGTCSIYVFVPFSDEQGNAVTSVDNFNDNEAHNGENLTNTGFSQMASAFLAVNQFNARDASVVPELANLQCNVTLEISYNNTSTSVIDAIPESHVAIQSLHQKQQWPCASVGPSSDIVGLELSHMAQAAKFPLVMARVYNLRAVSDDLSSFSASVFPDLMVSAEAVTNFLLFQQRTDSVAVLYETTDTGLQKFQVLTAQLEEAGISWMASGYLVDVVDQDGLLLANGFSYAAARAPLLALQKILDSGFRTIVVAMDTFDQGFEQVANAVEELGMNNGDYFYIWQDITAYPNEWTLNANTSKLIFGSALIRPIPDPLWNATSAYELAWSQQTSEQVEELNAANPKQPGEPGYVFAGPDFFQTVQPGFDAAFIYDAVMSVGLGACNATKAPNDEITGANHIQSIHNLSFSGATGQVIFGSSYEGYRNSRLINTTTWGALNLQNGYWTLAAISLPNTDLRWRSIRPFIYADNSTEAPLPLRAPGDQNYLSPAARGVGLALMSATILGCILSIAWIQWRQDHYILATSHPLYLQMVCVGIAVQTMTIFVLSWDENAGWSVNSLDQACKSLPWLLFLGHLIQYEALFLRLWAGHKYITFRRGTRIRIRALSVTICFVWLTSFLLLISWTLVDPFLWQRTTIDYRTNSSYGFCKTTATRGYGLALFLLSLIPVVFTAILAFKTKGDDDQFRDRWWLFMLILVQMEAAVVAAPVIVVLRDQAYANSLYTGYVVVAWIIPTGALLLLMTPRLTAYRRAQLGLDQDDKPKRGEILGVRVTGIPLSAHD